MFGARGGTGGGMGRPGGSFFDRWNFSQGRMSGGGMAMPPGVRVPMGNDARPPPAPMPAPRPPTGGPQTVAPMPGLPGPLGAAMGGAPTAPPPGAPAGPAAPGTGIPAGLPPPDAEVQGSGSGSPLLQAMLAPNAYPQDYLRRAGYQAGRV